MDCLVWRREHVRIYHLDVKNLMGGSKERGARPFSVTGRGNRHKLEYRKFQANIRKIILTCF